MQNQTTIKVVLVTGLLGAVLWWLLPGDNEDTSLELAGDTAKQNLVSAIQPIADADAVPNTQRLNETQTRVLQYTPQARDLKDFDKANTAIQDGDLDTAEKLLQGLIERQPGLLEPYVNLASAQAVGGNLEQARETLMTGLMANENYGALFSNLQKVHAALAADAYQLALSEDPTDAKAKRKQALQLPLVTALNANVAPGDEQALTGARNRIQELQEQLSSEQRNVVNKQQELTAANSILQTKDSIVQGLKEQLKVATSTATLSDQASNNATSKVEALQTRLTASQQQIAQMLETHETQVAALELELQQQRNGLSEQELLAKQEQQRQTQRINQLERELELTKSMRPPVVASATVAPEVTQVDKPDTVTTTAEPQPATATTPIEQTQNTDTGDRDELAIAHVQSWAKAWSEQDVEGYISHYQDGYVPSGSTISNADWRAQRQVRLTNKKFITVSVSDFTTKLDGDMLAVSFVQRYQSNTMDDTIRKQLRLVTDDNDWSQAKIVAERVLR